MRTLTSNRGRFVSEFARIRSDTPVCSAGSTISSLNLQKLASFSNIEICVAVCHSHRFQNTTN